MSADREHREYGGEGLLDTATRALEMAKAMVNLKLMYSLHDYSVYDIMAMRDYGKSFARINQQVYLAKEEMNKKSDEVLEAR